MAEMVVKRMTSRIFALFSLDLSLVIVSVRVISNTICVLKIVWYLQIVIQCGSLLPIDLI